MGYAQYTVIRRGEQIDAGYSVPDICNEPRCAAQINRGLGYLCGESPGGDEHGCGGYFCGEHLHDSDPARCARCRAAQEKQRREEFCDQLAQAVRGMNGVESADALADKPEVLIDLTSGDQFILSVS